MILALSLTACGGDGSDDSGSEFELPDLGGSDNELPTDTPTTEGDTPYCVEVGGDMEGCFDYSQMQAFYGEVIKLIDSYASYQYIGGSALMPDNWFYMATTDNPYQTGCTVLDQDGNRKPSMADGWSYMYCPPDVAVYVGQDQLWEFYSVHGDAAAAIGIAHEWGHYLQHYVGISPTTLTEVIAQENQADCVAGSFSKWAAEKGLFTEDDARDVGTLLPAIASAEGPDRDHGTTQERVDSFLIGFYQGMQGCNEFFPATPLITA